MHRWADVRRAATSKRLSVIILSALAATLFAVEILRIASVAITDYRHPNQEKRIFSGAGLPSSYVKLNGYEVLASRR